MNGDQQRLMDSLSELRSVLAESINLDATNRGRLEHAIAEIEAAIRPRAAPAIPVSGSPSQISAPNQGQPTLANRLSEVTFEFEASHPRLSGALGGVVDALSRMGI